MPQGQPWSDGVLFGPHAGALVVDPFPLVREALAGRLRTLGARDVEEAASLEEARVRAHVFRPLPDADRASFAMNPMARGF